MLRPQVILCFTFLFLSNVFAEYPFSKSSFPNTIEADNLKNALFAPFPNLDTTRRLCLIDEVHGTRPSNLPRNATGKNVLVGIIDTEFDTHHPAFMDYLGETRFIALWDQNFSTSIPTNRFGYGIIKRQAELQKDSLFGLSEDHVHGTLVASIAAGSDRAFGLYGAAPEAIIAAVKYSDKISNISDGISWIFSLADSLNLPCVINLSIGISFGPHDGTSLFDRFVDSVSGPGRIIVGAAGNDYPKGSHTFFKLSSGDTGRTWITPKTTTSNGNTFYISGIDIWGEQTKYFSVLPLIMDTATKVIDSFSKVSINKRSSGYTDLKLWKNPDGTLDSVLFNIAPEISTLNNKPHCQIAVQTSNKNLFAGVKIINGNDSANIHAWHVSKMALRKLAMSGFQDGDAEYNINEIGGTAKKIIVAGSYVGRASLKYWNDSIEVIQNPGNLAHFSSSGPTVDKRIKPDIVAPGFRIVAAMSRSSPADLTPVIWPDISRTTGRYCESTGTSASAPVVTGIIALMLEINPHLTPELALQCITKTAIHDQWTGDIIPVNRWGAGKINAAGAVQELITLSTVTPKPILKQSRKITMHQFGRTVLFRNIDKNGYAILFDLNGRKLLKLNINKNGNMTIPSNIAAGLFTIAVYGQNKTEAGVFKIAFDR